MLRILLATIVFLLSASFAQAAADCLISVGNLNFAEVDAIGNVEVETTAPVSIQCDGVESQTITVCGSIGEGSGGISGGQRQSTGPGNGSLGFGLYADGTAVPWGSFATPPQLGPPYRLLLTANGGSASADILLRGIVPAGQAEAPIGEYRADFVSDAVFTYAEGDFQCDELSGGIDVTTPFSVLASVTANCLLETNDLDFGTTGKIGNNIDAETDLDLICTTGTDYTISIDGGGAGDPAHRRLISGGNSVRYDLYSNDARTAPWGTVQGSTVTGNGDGSEQKYWVYGRIPPQPAAAGAYSDTVVVTITY